MEGRGHERAMDGLRRHIRRNPTIVATRPRRPLATSAAYAVAMVVAAVAIWILAVGASWDGTCPPHGTGEFRNAEPTGLDKGIYVWPPGAQCYADSGIVNHQAWPWATWAILGLIAGAAGVLLFGIVVTMRELRAPASRST